MRPIHLFLVFALGCCPLRFAAADEQIRSAQQALKDLGFYYGAVDGEPGADTTAAIRRYQIRSGLSVTGELSDETVQALKSAGNGDDQSHGAPAAPPAPVQRDDGDLRNDQPGNQADRDFLRRETQNARPPAPQTPPAPPAAPAPPVISSYASIFRGTPYESAPPEVQSATVRRAQFALGEQGYYHGQPDGAPGPHTARALTEFQDRSGLKENGRLDMETLARLGLLPGRQVLRGRVVFPGPPPPPPIRVYRGVWVQ